MVAGLLLGPSLVGKIAPGASAFLFAPASLDVLNTFSQFGLVLFKFLVGLQLDAAHLRSNRIAAAQTSGLSERRDARRAVGLGVL